MKLNHLLLIVIMAALPAISAASFSGQVAAQTLERIRETGTLRLGHRADARPFSYLDDAGKPAGYVVELCQGVAQSLKQQLTMADLKVDYVEVTTQDRFEAVASGKIDLLCGSSTVTLSRREVVSFSLPTFITGVSAVLRADESSILRDVLGGRSSAAPSRTLVVEAFRDRAFGVRSGTTAEVWLEQNVEKLAARARVVKVDDYAEGLAMVESRELDAFFGDRAILLDLILQQQMSGALDLGDNHMTYEPYALALARGDEDFRLAVDRALSRIYGSREVRALFTKYFGRPNETTNTLLLLSSLPE